MTSPSFPGALDSLANPGPTTETDDPGFELDVVIARLQNCIMAIEGKLGIVAGGPPASPSVLRRTATGSSMWQQVQGDDLASNVATNLSYVALSTYSASSTGGTLLTLTTPSWLGTGSGLAIISTNVSYATASGGIGIALTWQIDSGGDNFIAGAWNQQANGLTLPVVGILPLVGLSAASHTHTLKIQVNVSGGWTVTGGYMAAIELRK